MEKLKVKYDKKLEKYHVEYERIIDKYNFRLKHYLEINKKSDMLFIIETHLGSKNNPDPLEYTRKLERLLGDFTFPYVVQPIEARVEKNIFGVLNFGKKQIKDFSIAFVVGKDELTDAAFNTLFCEFDAQVFYHPTKSTEEILDDVTKGYFDTSNAKDYFGQNFYDSIIFNKFLATEYEQKKEA